MQAYRRLTTEEPTILSINPTIWEKERHVIDIAELLHATPALLGTGGDLQHQAALAFHAAGWPRQRITEEHRSNLKSPTRIDVALPGDAAQCVVAVEVKRILSPPNRSKRLREAWMQLPMNAPGVHWHCVTDGITYTLHNTITEKDTEIHHAFSPESLTTGDFTQKPSSNDSAPG